MSRSHFFEGIILGAIVGGIAGYLLAKSEDEASVSEKTTTISNSKESNKDLVSKTLNAIEQGFENISNMIDEKKRVN